MTHWTSGSPSALRMAVLAGFMCQIENKLETQQSSFGEFAERLGIAQAHLSQILAGDVVPPVELMFKMAEIVGLTPSFVAYLNPDLKTQGPLNPEVFVQLWEKAGRPNSAFEIDDLEITKKP